MTRGNAGRASRSNVAGLEWCPSLDQEIQDRAAEIGCIELIPENFFPEFGNFSPTRLSKKLCEFNLPVLIHGIGLSIGSIEPFKEGHFNKILEIAGRFATTVGLSDHLCMTERKGSDIGQLTSIGYDQDTLDSICKKIEQILKQTDHPFALENISHNFIIPNQQYSETEFINKIIDRTGIELLLDLNNIFTNGVNFGIDPYQWVSEIDLDCVNSIHLAGGFFDDDHFLQDGHCARVPEPVWDLFDWTLQRAKSPIMTIVERTGLNEEFGLQPVLEDQIRAQEIMDRIFSNKTDQLGVSAEVFR